MSVVREAIAQTFKTEGATSLEGWYYDLVLDRIESMGFVQKEGGSDGVQEASLYEHPSGGKFYVATNRLPKPITVIQFSPSPKKPAPKG